MSEAFFKFAKLSKTNFSFCLAKFWFSIFLLCYLFKYLSKAYENYLNIYVTVLISLFIRAWQSICPLDITKNLREVEAVIISMLNFSKSYIFNSYRFDIFYFSRSYLLLFFSSAKGCNLVIIIFFMLLEMLACLTTGQRG